jgi:lipopolysaccharide transport system ATP-binding protein
MRRAEIKSKFDEIVEFAGVERYIDTPVKRYSSGMYVRLAFAVAAHLESEILIVDEVLAVGDADFQKKCLGKMNDVSKGEGRTVLFVSHNITAIKTLCTKGLLLSNGHLELDGLTNEIVTRYLQQTQTEFSFQKHWEWNTAPGTEAGRLLEVEVITNETVLYIDDPINIRFKAQLAESSPAGRDINFSLIVNNQEEVTVFNVTTQTKHLYQSTFEVICHIPPDLLNDEVYHMRLLLVEDETIPLFDLNNVISIKTEERERNSNWHGKWVGTVRPQKLITWTYLD